MATQPGIARSLGWAPTDDIGQVGGPSQASIYNAGRIWTAAGFTGLGHVVSVNLTTGALSITFTDRSAPYHAGTFSAVRIYQAQEQFAQSYYLATHPNTDPRPHFFGNWALDQEIAVTATWHQAYAEVLVGSGSTGSLAYRSEPEFVVHENDGAKVAASLRAWGVAGRTLQDLGWVFRPGDLLLKSRRGALSVLSGSYQPETLIDQVQAELWLITPGSGTGERYTSSYSYQEFVDADGMRETNVPVVRSLTADALGHVMAFRPTADAPPYRTWVLEDGAGRIYRFDLSHYLTFLDGNSPGNYAKAYVVTQLADESSPQSAPIAYSYDNAGRLTVVEYPAQTGGSPRRYAYAYDDSGALTSITDPVGDSLSFEYLQDDVDLDERLLPRLKVQRIADGDGNQITYEYDYSNSVTRATLTGPAGDTRTVTAEYLEDTDDTHQRYVTSRTVHVTLGPSAPQTITTRSVYSTDGRFLLAQAIDSLGHSTSFEYNAYNQVTAVVDALGHRRERTYDVTATPTATAPNRYDLVGTSETSVDAAGRPYNIRASFGYARYDAISSPDPADTAQSTHRVATQTDPGGRTSLFGYDDQSNYLSLRASSFIDPLGNVSRRSYNDRGATLSETDASGNTSKWTYDPLGRLLSGTDPNGNTRHWLYDPSTGWLLTATDALAAPGDPAHSVRYEWNDAGQRIRDTDPVNARTEYAYDSSGRLRSVVQYDPATRVTVFTFDAVGNLTQLTNPAGNAVIIRYDEASRAYEVVQSGGSSSIQFERDPAGRVVKMTDRNGAATTYVYDVLGRLVSVKEPDWPASGPVNPGKQISVSYDPQDRRLRVSDSESAGDYVYRYNQIGNLVERNDPDGSKLLFGYDARNALVRIHDPASVIDLRFALDGSGLLRSLTDSAHLDPSVTFTYHRTAGAQADNLYKIDYGTSGIATRFEYDPNRQLTLVSHSRTGTPLASYSYDYRADWLIGGQGGTQPATYGYDDRKQLISEDDNLHDGYDAAGNRLWRAAAPPPVSQQAVFDAENRMISDGSGTTFTYDGNGNLTRRTPPAGPPTVYTYDGANRLRVVDDGSTAIRYVYDADNRLTVRTSQTGTQIDTRRYRYANRSILAELDARGNVTVLHTRDNDGRLLRRRSRTALSPAPSQDHHSLFYLSDGLGSVVRMVDWDGNSHLSRDYDAWGDSGRSGDVGTFRYRGAHEDFRTGLLIFGARWYDPGAGRWLSQDPVATLPAVASADLTSSYTALTNLYRYVLNNPLGLWDPTGFEQAGNDASGDDTSLPSWIASAINTALNLPDYWAISGSIGEGVNLNLGLAWSNRGPGVVGSWGASFGVGPPASLSASAGFLHPPWRDAATNDEVLAQLTGWCATGQAAFVGALGTTYSPTGLGGTGRWSGEVGLGTPTASLGLTYGVEIMKPLEDWFSDAVNGIKKLYGGP